MFWISSYFQEDFFLWMSELSIIIETVWKRSNRLRITELKVFLYKILLYEGEYPIWNINSLSEKTVNIRILNTGPVGTIGLMSV